jgi:hypothetical protein
MVAEAIALHRLGRAAQAEAQLEKLAREPDPVGDAARTDLASMLKSDGKLDAAWRALPDKPKTAVGWILRGLLLEARNDAAGALSSATRALELDPAQPEAAALRTRLAARVKK